MPKYIAREKFKKVTQEDPQPLLKGYNDIEIKDISEEGDDVPTIRFIISTASVDRDNDIIDVNGWDLNNYLKNPVVLFAHDNRQPPVGRGQNLQIENSALMADVKFMPRDMSELSYSLGQMYLGGFMKATSVGFKPIEWNFNEERGFGIDFAKQELLEFSLVPVPSNPDALMAAKAENIDTLPLYKWATKTLDEMGTKLWLPLSVMEKMAKEADPKGSVMFYINIENKGVLFDDKGEKISDVKLVTNYTGPVAFEKAHEEGKLVKPHAYEKDGQQVFVHHNNESGIDKLKLFEAMQDLAQGKLQLSTSDKRIIYDHLAKHYEELNIEAPEFKYIEHEVLKNFKDSYTFDLENGTLCNKTKNPPSEETETLSPEDIVKLTVDTAKSFLINYTGKLVD